jgi:hypothetical protein
LSGYTANVPYLATKIGELRSVSAAVLAAAGSLDARGGGLGPGDLDAAVQELADHWRDGIQEIGTRIDEMAGHVGQAMDNYEAAEAAAQYAFSVNPIAESEGCPTVPPTHPTGGRR